MLIKQKSPSISRNLALGTFGKLQIVFSTKVNLLYLLYLLKTFLKTVILMTQVSQVFFSRTNLKLPNISVTPKMIKKKDRNEP